MRKVVVWGDETGFRMNSVNHPAGNRRVAVNPPVAQEWPVAPNIFKGFQIYFRNQDFFFIVRSLRNYSPKRVRNERPAPEFQALARRLLATNVAVFKACLLYTSPSPRDLSTSRMPSSA